MFRNLSLEKIGPVLRIIAIIFGLAKLIGVGSATRQLMCRIRQQTPSKPDGENHQVLPAVIKSIPWLNTYSWGFCVCVIFEIANISSSATLNPLTRQKRILRTTWLELAQKGSGHE